MLQVLLNKNHPKTVGVPKFKSGGNFINAKLFISSPNDPPEILQVLYIICLIQMCSLVETAFEDLESHWNLRSTNLLIY